MIWTPLSIPKVSFLIFFPPKKISHLSNGFTRISWYFWEQLISFLTRGINNVHRWKSNTWQPKQPLIAVGVQSNVCKKSFGFSSNIHLCKPWNSPIVFDAPTYPCPHILDINNPWESSKLMRCIFSIETFHFDGQTNLNMSKLPLRINP